MRHLKQSPFQTYLWLAVAILLAGFFLRINMLDTMPRGIHNDEATNLIWAWRWQAGYGMPFYFDSRPEPFDSFLRAGWAHLAGLTPFAHRTFNILLGMVGIAGCMAGAKHIFRKHPQVQWIVLVAGITLATIPANIIINRSIYRANWVIAAMGLALYFTSRATQTRYLRWTVAAGIFSGITAVFYLSGLAFLPAIGLGLLLTVLQEKHLRDALPIREAFAFVASVSVVMIPWITLYLLLPDWLGGRIDALEPVNPIESPADAWWAFWAALRPIIAVDPTEWENIRYNTLTASFLTLPQTILALCGVVGVLWQWRRPHRLTILLVLIFMVFPAAFSGNPNVVIRTIGVFVPLSLLVGFGGGIVIDGLSRLKLPSYLAQGTVLIGSVLLVGYAQYHITYHYRTNPQVNATPNGYFSITAAYHLGYHDLADYIQTSDTPVYLPADLLNENIAALLRPSAFPIVSSYDGTPLPVGDILISPADTFDFPPLDVPLQYALFLPDEGRVVLLPPIEASQAIDLFAMVRSSEDMLTNNGDDLQAWGVAHRIANADAQALIGDYLITPETETPIGIYDDNLTLVDMVVPRGFTAGTRFPVTLFWRLEQPTDTYYLFGVQPLDYQNEARGFAEVWFNRWFFPTAMWEADTVMPATVWITAYEDAPSGAYRYLVNIMTPPTFERRMPTLIDPTSTVLGQSLVAERSVVDFEPPFAPLENPIRLDASLGDAILLDAGTLSQTDTNGLQVTLEWSALATPGEDYTLFVHVEDNDGNLIAQRDTQPLAGQYPTGHWQTGDIIQTSHIFNADELQNCPCEVYVGMYLLRTGARLPVNADNADDTNRVPVGNVTP